METTEIFEADQNIVEAVRDGDAERYRELVERHQHRVYAVAWSRLGDPHLAEEATQETFIRAYRRLWLLGDSAKFAGWISSIARNAAINLGMRHRRELNKRERWALEQSFAPETSSSESAESCTPELLRKTLEELPQAHRECLVLFYLENKSGADAAAVLGITESAFRVRLHRARGALRERLEEQLAESLVKLRPAKTLVPAVMAAVLASSSAKAATSGASAAVLGALVKLAPFKWAFSFCSLIPLLPMLLTSWLVGEKEAKNFRDQNGFRVRLFRQSLRWSMLGFTLAMLCIWIFKSFFPGDPNKNTLWLLLAVFLLFPLPFQLRRLAINRNPYYLTMLLSSVITLPIFVLVGTGVAMSNALFWVLTFPILLNVFSYNNRPVRMDFNLFLRESENLLSPESMASEEQRSSKALAKSDLLEFSRFLGSRWLVNDYRWIPDGLALRLTPVNFSHWGLFLGFGRWDNGSKLLLHFNGTVSATLHDNDSRAMERLQSNLISSVIESEQCVAVSVKAAWENFRQGQFSAAERLLGERAIKEVFVKSPDREPLMQLRRIAAVILVILLVAQWVSHRSWVTNLFRGKSQQHPQQSPPAESESR
jgi:RNA polymerase sigma-70 factor (ECF subfamily)